MRIENLESLFLDQLKDAYDFEHQLVDALGEMEEAASSPQLKRAFAEHRKQTERQAQRLERVFEGLGEEPERKTCKAMKGLVAEGREIVSASGDDAAIDAGLIAAAQKVEHYEMATYGCLRTFAQQLGREREARLLQEILEEESRANEKLTGIATRSVNQGAQGAESHRSGSAIGDVLGSLGLGSRSRSAQGGDGVGRRSAKGAASRRSAGARTRRGNGDGVAEQTKEELLAEARRLGIEGRSQMNKAQLAREVQKQQRH